MMGTDMSPLVVTGPGRTTQRFDLLLTKNKYVFYVLSQKKMEHIDLLKLFFSLIVVLFFYIICIFFEFSLSNLKLWIKIKKVSLRLNPS